MGKTFETNNILPHSLPIKGNMTHLDAKSLQEHSHDVLMFLSESCTFLPPCGQYMQ